MPPPLNLPGQVNSSVDSEFRSSLASRDSEKGTGSRKTLRFSNDSDEEEEQKSENGESSCGTSPLVASQSSTKEFGPADAIKVMPPPSARRPTLTLSAATGLGASPSPMAPPVRERRASFALHSIVANQAAPPPLATAGGPRVSIIQENQQSTRTSIAGLMPPGLMGAAGGARASFAGRRSVAGSGAEGDTNPGAGGGRRWSAMMNQSNAGRRVSKAMDIVGLTKLIEEDDSFGPWIESTKANLFFGSVILINAMFLGVETDVRGTTDEGAEGFWLVAESIFILIFGFEIGLRIRCYTYTCLKEPWNAFDLFLVVSAIADAWIISHITDEGSVGLLSLLRIVRLMKLCRIIRLFRFLRELLLLAQGIWGAMKALVWAMVLMFLTLYMCAIFTTQLLGEVDDPQMKEWFGSVGASLFTLFQLMTLEGWPDVARHCTKALGTVYGSIAAACFVAFVMFTNLTLLNLVTGVILENVLATAKREEEQRVRKEEAERIRLVAEIRDLFEASLVGQAQRENNGQINIEDFRRAMLNPRVNRQLKSLGLAQHEAEEVFTLMDVTKKGYLSMDIFIEGCLRVRGAARAKHLLSVQFDVQKAWYKLSDQIEHSEERLVKMTDAQVRTKQTMLYNLRQYDEVSTKMLIQMSGNPGVASTGMSEHLLELQLQMQQQQEKHEARERQEKRQDKVEEPRWNARLSVCALEVPEQPKPEPPSAEPPSLDDGSESQKVRRNSKRRRSSQKRSSTNSTNEETDLTDEVARSSKRKRSSKRGSMDSTAGDGTSSKTAKKSSSSSKRGSTDSTAGEVSIGCGSTNSGKKKRASALHTGKKKRISGRHKTSKMRHSVGSPAEFEETGLETCVDVESAAATSAESIVALCEKLTRIRTREAEVRKDLEEKLARYAADREKALASILDCTGLNGLELLEGL